MDRAGGGVSNGYYGGSSDGGGGGGGDNRQQQSKDDFEDYMWMADEEEVEKQMLKQIEDEQIAQKCYNEMVEEEERLAVPSADNKANMTWQAGQMGGWSTGCPPPTVQPQQHQQQPWSTCPPAAPPPEDALAHDIGSLSVNDRPKVELNPMAAEFVPGQSFQSASG